MGSSVYVSDAVWERLDPRAGRLSRAQRFRVFLFSLAGAVVIAAVLLVFASGLLIPRFNGAADITSGRHPNYRVRATITNNGWAAERVSELRLSQSGVAVLSSTPRSVMVESGATDTFVLRIHISSCRDIRPVPLTVIADVHPAWGSQETRTMGVVGPLFASGLYSACHRPGS